MHWKETKPVHTLPASFNQRRHLICHEQSSQTLLGDVGPNYHKNMVVTKETIEHILLSACGRISLYLVSEVYLRIFENVCDALLRSSRLDIKFIFSSNFGAPECYVLVFPFWLLHFVCLYSSLATIWIHFKTQKLWNKWPFTAHICLCLSL